MGMRKGNKVAYFFSCLGYEKIDKLKREELKGKAKKDQAMTCLFFWKKDKQKIDKLKQGK